MMICDGFKYRLLVTSCAVICIFPTDDRCILVGRDNKLCTEEYIVLVYKLWFGTKAWSRFVLRSAAMKITSLESGYVAPEDTTTLFMEGVAGERSWGG